MESYSFLDFQQHLLVYHWRVSEWKSLETSFYTELNENPGMKIAFCWKEHGVTVTGNNICTPGTIETSATATVDSLFWLINGKKEGDCLGSKSTQPWLLYDLCSNRRTFLNRVDPRILLNRMFLFLDWLPSSYPRSCIFEHEDYEENGIALRRISFKDVLLPLESCEVLPAEVDGINAVNFKIFWQP